MQNKFGYPTIPFSLPIPPAVRLCIRGLVEGIDGIQTHQKQFVSLPGEGAVHHVRLAFLVLLNPLPHPHQAKLKIIPRISTVYSKDYSPYT